jgi:hypothetical protein
MNTNGIVSVNIMGGLGNQMFQLATAYAYSRKYGGRLSVMRNKRENDGRPTYWNIGLENFNKFLSDNIPNELEQWQENNATEFSIIPPLTKKGIYLKGYLQSPKYFNDTLIQNELKQLFRPNTSTIKYIESKYGPLIKNKDRIVVVHARRTDYLRNQDIINFHGPLSVEYYKEGINKMCKLVNNPIFLLAADDCSFWPSVIRETPEINEENMYILYNENEVNTLALLQQFKYFIIANSTFSWWASWLSDKPHKVIAPSKWFGPTGPKNYTDIFISDWELI